MQPKRRLGKLKSGAAPKEYEWGRGSCHRCPPVQRRRKAPARADPTDRIVHLSPRGCREYEFYRLGIPAPPALCR